MRQKLESAANEMFRRLYISSRRGSAKDFAKWIRQHWSVENNCHWVADVIFEEDAILADRGNSARQNKFKSKIFRTEQLPIKTDAATIRPSF